MTAQAPLPPPSEPPEVATAGTSFLQRPSTARILPFAVYMAFIAVADLLERLGWSAEALRWLYPIKTAAVLAVLLAYRRYYVELVGRPLGWSSSLSAIATGVVVLVLWINLDASWMQVGAAAGFDPTMPGGRIDWFLVAIRIAGAALVVPVMEELFWRSFLLRWFEQPAFLKVYPAAVGLKSVVVTVILFGVEHNLWLAGIVAGVAYTAIYMRSGSLWAAILAHAVTNGLLGAWVVATGSWTYW